MSIVASSIEKAAYALAFIRRTQMARFDTDYTQKAIADLLGIEQDLYKTYETRSLIPHYLIPRFCAVCNISIHWLMTGIEVEGIKPRSNRIPRLPIKDTRHR